MKIPSNVSALFGLIVPVFGQPLEYGKDRFGLDSPNFALSVNSVPQNFQGACEVNASSSTA